MMLKLNLQKGVLDGNSSILRHMLALRFFLIVMLSTTTWGIEVFSCNRISMCTKANQFVMLNKWSTLVITYEVMATPRTCSKA